jgi:hypothetical protein
LNTERWLLHAKAFCRAGDIALFHNSYEIPDQLMLAILSIYRKRTFMGIVNMPAMR